jgi:hypothetical protein
MTRRRQSPFRSVPSTRAAVALAVAIGSAAVPSCTAKDGQLYDRVFPCDSEAAPDQCGTGRDGKRMICYAGHLLGGQDFCAARCDPSQSLADNRFTCLNAGALVQKCKPAAGRDDPHYACPDGLSCYRNDLLEDDGICLMMNVCSETADCGGAGIVCAAALVQGAIANVDGIATDSLQCIRYGCGTLGSTCPTDQACLRKVYAAGTALPDICVPKCDNFTCPPNFSCARKDDWAPGAPAVCVPGVPGTRCDDDQDCIIGACLDTGAGFHVCTLAAPCRPNDYCSSLDGPDDAFICAEGVPGQPRCVDTRPLGGPNCADTRDCASGSGRACLWYSMYEEAPLHGECRLPCDADRHCAPQGGVPFFCLGENGEGGCYPTQFSAPCVDDSDCFELACLSVSPDPRSRTNYSPKMCTLPCTSDADCDANHQTLHRGFCQTDVGVCRLAGSPGAPCSQATHCRSRLCGPGGTCLQ